MTTQATQPTGLGFYDFMCTSESAEYLGVTRAYICVLAHRDRIPSVKRGSALWFKRSDVEHYARTRRVSQDPRPGRKKKELSRAG